MNPKAHPLSSTSLAAYSALSIPLAMAALPIYVHIPKLYSTFGLSLAWIGTALLAVRALDAIIDPTLGRWSDRVGSRKRFIAYALPWLALGVFITFSPALFNVPAQAVLILGLFLTYVGYSAVTVAYHAWGAQWAQTPFERTRVTVWREGVGLFGVLAAAAVPVVLTERFSLAQGYSIFAYAVVASLICFGAMTLMLAPEPIAKASTSVQSIKSVVTDSRFQRLLIAFALNGIAAAIPATLFLFFVDDVIRANTWQAHFLIAYFMAGALAAPVWLYLSATLGKRKSWALSMLIAMSTFIWAAFVGAGDRIEFLWICILSGAALGADLTLPPSMLADTIESSHAQDSAGSYFGVWTMVNKLNLALAAGIALPALAALGYVPNVAGTNTYALTIAYCVLPCALKTLALIALYFVKDE